MYLVSRIVNIILQLFRTYNRVENEDSKYASLPHAERTQVYKNHRLTAELC